MSKPKDLSTEEFLKFVEEDKKVKRGEYIPWKNSSYSTEVGKSDSKNGDKEDTAEKSLWCKIGLHKFKYIGDKIKYRQFDYTFTERIFKCQRPGCEKQEIVTEMYDDIGGHVVN